MARNKNSIDDIYSYYYLNQAGTGFGSVYAGNVYQRGHGIGSFLGGLFRCVFPLLKSGTAKVGSELLKTGANIVSDIARNEDFDTVIKRRGKETIENLGRMAGEKMFGHGYTTTVSRKRKQSQTKARGGKKAKKTKTASKRRNQQIRKKQNKSKRKKHHEQKTTYLIFSYNGIHKFTQRFHNKIGIGHICNTSHSN